MITKKHHAWTSSNRRAAKAALKTPRGKEALARGKHKIDTMPPDEYFAQFGLTCRQDKRRNLWARTLWRKYRLTVEDEARLYQKQNGTCPLCFLPLGMSWCLDHDHKRNPRAVRSLLHDQCNMILGIVEKRWTLPRLTSFLNKGE